MPGPFPFRDNTGNPGSRSAPIGRPVAIPARIKAQQTMTTIKSFRLWRVRVPFKSTMRSSRGSLDEGEKVILELKTDDGTCGLGEASVIFPSRSGESAATIFVALRDMFGPRLLGRDPMHLARILDDLESITSEQYGFLATKCAIDLALHDLKARLLGLSVADLLGGAARSRIALSRSISVMPDPQLVDSAVRLADQGYRLLTLKGTGDWKANITTFERVRSAVPGFVGLEIDPNQAWQPKDAIAVDAALAPLGLECIEQPCAWWDLEGMQRVTQRAQSRIAADESVLSAPDVIRVARMGAADMVTLKLAKSGGIRHTAQMVDAAIHAGLSCNVGSKHPLGVGAAAILHFAAAYPTVGEFLGYGSALERFVGDVINETLVVEDGEAWLPAGPGLGVSLDHDALARYVVELHDSSAAR